jgi:hypothetical protein
MASGALQTDDRFRLDNYQRILPARPSHPQDRPEEPIQRAQRRPGLFPLQDSHLLAKREDFDSDVSAALEKDAGGGNQGEDEWQHGLLVLT